MKTNSFQQFTRSFEIMSKYLEKGYLIESEHETIYAHIDFDIMNQEDVEELKELGWFLINDDIVCLGKSVLGFL